MQGDGGHSGEFDAPPIDGGFGSPLTWTAASKAFALVLTTAPFVVAYLARVTHLLVDPSLEPYLDAHSLRLVQRVLGVALLAVVSALAAYPLVRRRWPNGRGYPTAVLIGWFTVLGVATYLVGPFTSPALAGMLAGAMGALVLFEIPVATVGIVTGLAVLAATTVAERARLLPYGPVFARMPTDHGHPTNTFVLVNALFMVALFAVILTLLGLTVRSWRRADAEVRRLATVDSLTQLKNRRHLFERLRGELDRSRRYKSPLTFVLLDLDHFKPVNDRFGHVVGDRLLAAIARVIEERGLRTVDVAARYGGEEIALLLPETDRDGALVVAERLRTLISSVEVTSSRGEAVHVTVSVGLSTYPDPRIERLEDLVRLADEALYRAKAAGRDRVAVA